MKRKTLGDDESANKKISLVIIIRKRVLKVADDEDDWAPKPRVLVIVNRR